MPQSVFWLMLLASMAALLGAGLATSWHEHKRKPQPLPTDWALGPRPVFSSDERRVYRLLREAFPQHVVLSKLPLVRFCQPTNPQDVRYWYELLGASAVGFAVCSANGRVLAAIDLQGDRNSSRRSAQIRAAVLSACRVRYLRCPPGHLPSVPELQLLMPEAGDKARFSGAMSKVNQSRDKLASTVASRRLERATLWQDSRSAIDSTFDSGPSSLNSLNGLNSLNSLSGVSSSLNSMSDIGGVVVDSRLSAVRH